MKILLSLLMAALIFTAGSCDEPQPEAPVVEDSTPIRIGALFALTSEDAERAAIAVRGIALAMKELNDIGTLGDRKFQLILADIGAHSETTARALHRLSEEDDVDVIITHSRIAFNLGIIKSDEANDIALTARTRPLPTYPPDQHAWRSAEFNRNYREEYGVAPEDDIAALGYTIVHTLAEAIYFGKGSDSATLLKLIPTLEFAGGPKIATEPYKVGSVELAVLIPIQSGVSVGFRLTPYSPEDAAP